MPRCHRERTGGRIAPSCWSCRRKKSSVLTKFPAREPTNQSSRLKCDRGLPACSNCVRRGEVTVCGYASAEQSATRQASSPLQPTEASGNGPPNPALEKLAHLERTVLQFASSQHGHVLSASERGDRCIAMPAAQEWTRQSVDQARWSSVLQQVMRLARLVETATSTNRLTHQIQEVRTYLHAQHERSVAHENTAPAFVSPSIDQAPTLLLGCSRNVTRCEILLSVPSRHSCDLLVDRFFAHLYPPLCILHEPTFRRQYEEFWDDPNAKSTVWLAMLFAILRIAALDYVREDDEHPQFKGQCKTLGIGYRQRVADCLVLANYLEPHEFLIGALILHQYAEYVSDKDARSSVWVLTGTIIRLAMRMGYHQTSQPTLCQSPFKAEMRRRAWTYLRQVDIMLSFQMGLPSMIDLDLRQGDLPRNIFDDENFHEGCSLLPPQQPDSEPTQVSFLLAKTKLAFGFARALAELHQQPDIDCQRLLEMDRELRGIYEGIPPLYKIGQFRHEDSFVLCSARFSLAAIHHKSICVIHSPFVGHYLEDPRYLYSTRACLTSALSILRMQATQDEQMPIGGRLRKLTSYQTSLATHDYLLAAAILCNYLFSRSSDEQRSMRSNSPSGLPSRMEILKALKGSVKIFQSIKDRSVDAQKAADVLGALLIKLRDTMDAPRGGCSRRRHMSKKLIFHSRRQEGSLPASTSAAYPSIWISGNGFPPGRPDILDPCSPERPNSAQTPRYLRGKMRNTQHFTMESGRDSSPGICDSLDRHPMWRFEGDASGKSVDMTRNTGRSQSAPTPTCTACAYQDLEVAIARNLPLESTHSLESSYADGGPPLECFFDQHLPSLAINQPLSALWTLTNVDQDFDAFAGF